jgi:hypothetical protein
MKVFTEIKRYFLRVSSKGSKAGPKDDPVVGILKIHKQSEKFTERYPHSFE